MMTRYQRRRVRLCAALALCLAAAVGGQCGAPGDYGLHLQNRMNMNTLRGRLTPRTQTAILLSWAAEEVHRPALADAEKLPQLLDALMRMGDALAMETLYQNALVKQSVKQVIAVALLGQGDESKLKTVLNLLPTAEMPALQIACLRALALADAAAYRPFIERLAGEQAPVAAAVRTAAVDALAALDTEEQRAGAQARAAQFAAQMAQSRADSAASGDPYFNFMQLSPVAYVNNAEFSYIRKDKISDILAPLLAGLADDDPLAAAVARRALQTFATKESLAIIISMLDGPTLYTAREVLTLLTAQNFGDDIAQWQAWLAQQ